jgi:hypothetical protein
MKRISWVVLASLLAAGEGVAKMDLVTLPERDTVQLTIYNSADLTLVRESRALTMQKGQNKLQFSWENTLIDPTSLGLLPLRDAGKIDVSDLTYPPRVRNLGLWTINSKVNGKVPVEITYLTSGISWRAFYMGTLTSDEKQMRLEGYVRVANNSGEDYANAQTRLIVGQVNMIDQIASLAQRQYPYGSPVPMHQLGMWRDEGRVKKERELPAPMVAFAAAEVAADRFEVKEIIKEGLSEYFLYTIEGKETIQNGWSKRLPSFEAGEVPVVNLYKYEEDRYGQSVMRFLSFKNDEKYKLGQTPIPGGMLKVYRDVGQASHLSYEGQSEFKYIPVGEDVELELGGVRNVVVEPKVMSFKTDEYSFNRHGDVDGWVEIRDIRFEVKNTREIPVKVEITRNLGTKHWSVENQGDCGTYEKVDLDTVKYTLELAPRTARVFTQVLTTRHGRKAE